MAKEEAIEVTGTVIETLPNAMFRVSSGRQRTYCSGTYFRKNAKEFHPDSAGR